MKVNSNLVLIGMGTALVLTTAFIYRRQISAGVDAIVDYAFSAEQEAFLKELHPDHAAAFRKFISDVEKNTPYRVLITSGYRSFLKQLALNKENSQNAKPGKSMHNYGLAIDLNLIHRKDGTSLRKLDTSAKWEATGVVKIAKKYGLKWGGAGNFGSYHDPVHFEIPLGGDKLYSAAIKQFGTESKVIGNRLNLAA